MSLLYVIVKENQMHNRLIAHSCWSGRQGRQAIRWFYRIKKSAADLLKLGAGAAQLTTA
jgi:hypothetical protein